MYICQYSAFFLKILVFFLDLSPSFILGLLFIIYFGQSLSFFFKKRRYFTYHNICLLKKYKSAILMYLERCAIISPV